MISVLSTDFWFFIFSFELGISVLAFDFQTLILANKSVTLVPTIKYWISVPTFENGKKNCLCFLSIFQGKFFQ
jgi:hypothetical protein